ncbi:UNKNOWN [Stylonychia lemnae]|uniref:CKK domain-containing protein n=1 Tax=Stylonychia lemnae TaxID=5949 RepID=A0A078AVU1_STYLE|nr:UNKNOWN [Stylonychia lemnae]|eukprot:CDW86206.1 UNKNOWN [Stylonychia lemnae]
MDPIKKEIERQKQRWEENVRKQNEEKKQKELERKKQLEEQRKQKELKKLEELKKQTDSILLEEKKRMDQLKQAKQGNSRDVSKILRTSQNIEESQNTMLHEDAKTDYNMLESLLDPGTVEKQKQEVVNKYYHMSQTQKDLQEFMDLETNVKNSLDIDKEKQQKKLIEQREEQLRKDLENFQQDLEDEDDQEITVQQKDYARLIEEQQQIHVRVDHSYIKPDQMRQSQQSYDAMYDSLQKMDELPGNIRSSIEQNKNSVNKQQVRQSQVELQSNLQSTRKDNSQTRVSIKSNKPFQQENQQKEIFLYKEKSQEFSEPVIQAQQKILDQNNKSVTSNTASNQSQNQRKLGRKEEFLMKMQIEEQMKKMSQAQQSKKRKDEEEIMRKKQEILAQVMGKKQPIQNQVIVEESERNSQSNQSIQSKINNQRLQVQLTERSDFHEESSINDRDSEDEEYYQDYKNKYAITNNLQDTKEMTNAMFQKQRRQSPSSNANPDYDSEFYKYSEDTESKVQDTNSNYISENVEHLNEESNKKRNNLQSASSKNRQEYYEKYNMDMSVKSMDYDKMYQHGQTKELQDLNSRLSQTHSQLKGDRSNQQSKIIEYQQQPKHDVRASQNSKIITFGKDDEAASLIDVGDSMVNIETSLNPRIDNQYADDDLPEELREYERQLLAQLDQEQDEDDDYYFQEDQIDPYAQVDNRSEDQLDDSQQIRQVERSRQQISAVDSKFRVSLAAKNSQSGLNNKNSDLDQDEDTDPLREYYELQKQKHAQAREDEFYDQFDQHEEDQKQIDDHSSYRNQTSRSAIQFDKTQKTIDFHSPNANNIKNLNYQGNDQDQSYHDDFEGVDQTEPLVDDLDNNDEQDDYIQQNQKGIALDFGIDEGTIKERKMKKFEELRQRKLLEEQKRKQQQNRGKSTEKTVESKPAQRKIPSKSPMRDKSPMQKKDQHGLNQQKLIRRPAAFDQNEEAKNIIQVSQSRFDKLENKPQPLAANVPQHLLKKQQHKQEVQHQQQVTPKQTPSQNPQSKKNFAKNSNKKIIRNAIQVILAGDTNKLIRDEVLKVIDDTDYPYYIVLFKGNIGRQDFKALYQHDGIGLIEKIMGSAGCPDIIEDKMVEKFFRYDSGNKIFKELAGIKSISLTTDAVALHKKFNHKVSNNALF